MWVADYTARIAPSAMPADLAGSCRYVSRYAWKVCSAAEFREIEASGRRCVLNFEDSANDWLQLHPQHRGAPPPEAHRWLGGAATGASDAAFAVAAARAIGYPPGRPLPGSCDIDMTRTQWTASGKAYAVAWRNGVRAGGYGPGVYGPWDVLTWVRDEVGGYAFYWQAGMSTAWSGGRNATKWPDAHLRQRRHVTVGGQDVDYNDILRSDWAGPVQEEAFMALTDAEQRKLLALVENAERRATAEADTDSPIIWPHPWRPGQTTSPNPKAQVLAAVKALGAGVPAVLSPEQLAALVAALPTAEQVAALMPKPPTAAEVAAELIRQLAP